MHCTPEYRPNNGQNGDLIQSLKMLTLVMFHFRAPVPTSIENPFGSKPVRAAVAV